MKLVTNIIENNEYHETRNKRNSLKRDGNLRGVQKLPHKVPGLGGGLHLQEPRVSLIIASRVELFDRLVDECCIIHTKYFV